MYGYTKQFTTYVAALAVGALVLVLLLQPVEVFAQAEVDQQSRRDAPRGTFDRDAGVNTVNTSDLGCSGFSVSCYMYQALVSVGALGTTLATGVLFISMTLTNFAAELTLGGANYSSAGMPFLMSGWALVRDFVNLIFIFILLWIAIATVLGLESYGYKQLLPRLIIVAFIINFSLVFTRLVIDASNLLAVQFLNSIGSLPRVFGAALHPQQILLLAKTAGSEGMGGFVETAVQIIVSSFLGSFLILAAAFIVLVGGLFLIVRLGVLWFVLILSPAAVAASILPQTRAYFQKWFHLLVSYAAFAPIYFFFIWLTGKFVVDSVAGQASVLNQLASTVNSDPAAAGIVGQAGFTGAIFRIAQMSTRYILAFMLLLLSLIFARQLGIAGANGAWKLVGQARGGALGALRSTGVAAGRFGRRRVARTAETVASKLAQGTPGKIPFAARAFSRIASGARASIKNDVSALEEKYKRYSNKEKKKLFGAIETTREGKAAIMNLLAKDGDLKAEGDFTQERIASGAKILRALGLPDKDVLRLRPDLAMPGKIADAVKFVTPDDIPKMDAVVFKNKEVLDAMVRYFKQRHIQRLIERIDGTDQIFFGELAKFGKTADEISFGLKNIGNIPLSTFFTRGQGKALLDSYISVPRRAQASVPQKTLVLETEQERSERLKPPMPKETGFGFGKTLQERKLGQERERLEQEQRRLEQERARNKNIVMPPEKPSGLRIDSGARPGFVPEPKRVVEPETERMGPGRPKSSGLTPPTVPPEKSPPAPPKPPPLNISPSSPTPSTDVSRRDFFRQLRPGSSPQTPPPTPPSRTASPVQPPPISRREFLRRGGIPPASPPPATLSVRPIPPMPPRNTPPPADDKNKPGTP